MARDICCHTKWQPFYPKKNNYASFVGFVFRTQDQTIESRKGRKEGGKYPPSFLQFSFKKWLLNKKTNR